MRTKHGQFANKSSMLTLALLVLGGAVITTLVQAEDTVAPSPAPPSYLQPQLYRAAPVSADQSQHHWLLPTSLHGRFEQGHYNVYFQQESAEFGPRARVQPDTRMSLSVGDGQGLFTSAHDRAMMSDWERSQAGINGTVFSMSIGRRW